MVVTPTNPPGGESDLKTKFLALFAVVVGSLFFGSNSVVATPGANFEGKVLAKGTLAGPARMDALGVEFSTDGSTDVIVQQVDFAPGGFSGWHQHPGLVVVAVASGAVTSQVGCDPMQVFSDGQSFVEPPLTSLIVSNASSTVPARTYATLVVPAGRAARIEVLVAPDCSAEETDRSPIIR
jgi:quercetin dioxygenase-like cupin family protein